MYSKFVLLPGESTAEYTSLLNGLRDDWQPCGEMESVEVENLALLMWRKRRFFEAENGVIALQIAYPNHDEVEKQELEAMELLRNPIAGGGLLMHAYRNRFLIPETVAALKLLRIAVEKLGFHEDSPVVAKLCAEHRVGETPSGFRLVYEAWAGYAKASEEPGEVSGGSRYRKEMIKEIDVQIESLKTLEVVLAALEDKRASYQRRASLLPREGASD